MTFFKRKLPSINALVTLEAAVRLKSFTLAARELNVTQAAVSRQVRLLEDELGSTLFQRGQRSLEPTAAGAMLGSAMNQALDVVSATVDDIRDSSKAQSLTIGATLAVSYFWLLPRLRDFREQNPGLKVKIVSQDEPFDLRAGEIDVLLRFGLQPFADGRTVLSASDRFFPVCSPAFARTIAVPSTARDFMLLPLIGSDVSDPLWMLWADWFERAGAGRRSPSVAVQFNHYTDGIAAAVGGQGIALGWNLIVGDLLANGQLVCLGEKLDADAAYNVVVSGKKPMSAGASALVDWLALMFRQSGSHVILRHESQNADLERLA